MSNDYAYYSGMQHSVILASQPYGLGLDEKLMPQYLKQLGYATHAVGKVRMYFEIFNLLGNYITCKVLIK